MIDKHDAFVRAHAPSASEVQTWTIIRGTLLSLQHSMREMDDEVTRVHDQLMACLTERNTATAQVNVMRTMALDYLATCENDTI